MLNAVAQGEWVTLAEYSYDDQHRLVRAKDADGFSSKCAYDTDGRFTLDHVRAGLPFDFRHRADGKCIESDGGGFVLAHRAVIVASEPSWPLVAAHLREVMERRCAAPSLEHALALLQRYLRIPWATWGRRAPP